MIALWNLIVVGICLVLFFAVNLHNMVRHHTLSLMKPKQPEIPTPSALSLGGLTLGTGVFFLESLLYLLLAVPGNPFSSVASLTLKPIDIIQFEFAGATTMTVGYVIFIWSVIARGKYATSWEMSAEHKLVDWGPYRYVRHPSYLGYFLMFIGFFLMWPNLLALIPMVAIPAYALVAKEEESMLVKKFGNSYKEYQLRVGQFLPKISLNKSSRSICGVS